jgi:ribonucleoside-diphosphate reductase subunit M2
MESPLKKVSFVPEAEKENMQQKYASDEVAVPVKGIPDLADLPDEDEAPSTDAPAGKDNQLAEPLLQENPQRFVLFPIKYHEVCMHSTRPDA